MTLKEDRETNIIAMRLGPGKHLKGKKLMHGVVSPEDFTYMHEVRSYTFFPLSPFNVLS
jgi:hypothetical protein